MKQYIGTKLINAEPMTRQQYNELRGWSVPADENPEDAGYLVEYLDGGRANHPDFAGYISWSPDDVFATSYRQVDGMSFGLALEAMKQGFRVRRAGWNGTGMFAYYVPGGDFPARTAAISGVFSGDMVPYRPYLALKTAQHDVATWAPSVSDALADDWQIC